MKKGDHVRVRRPVGYIHHGIYGDDGTVIHYWGESYEKKAARIRRDSLKEFEGSGTCEVVDYSKCFPPGEVVRRAESRLGENGYLLFGNNCEHFARWCKTGEACSEQVTDLKAAGGALGGVGLVARGGAAVAVGVGAAKGLGGGAGLMAGLKAIGSAATVATGGAVAGVVALGVGPALVVGAAMTQGVLKDDEKLSKRERKARKAGRIATGVGAGAGAIGSVVAIAVSGKVVGLGGAGITSGLAAIGGGMTSGLFVATAAPAAAAAVVGYGTYRLWKWLS